MANITRYKQPSGPMPLSEAADRLVRDAFTWPRLFSEAAPPGAGLGLGSNLYETNDSYIMQVMLPGVKADELEITARQQVLMLRGKTEIAVPENAQGIWVGMGGGEFRQEVALPGEVDAEQASADFQDGILTLTLPKNERSKVRTIKIGAPPTAIEGEK